MTTLKLNIRYIIISKRLNKSGLAPLRCRITYNKRRKEFATGLFIQSCLTTYSPGQLEVRMEEFVKYYNYQRYHESLQNLTPSEVYFGTGHKKLKQRKLTKNKTLEARKKQFQKNQLNLGEYSLKFGPKKFKFVGRHTLYKKWKLSGNQIIFTVESVGNGTSSIDDETYIIDKLTKDRLVLKNGEYLFEYTKK